VAQRGNPGISTAYSRAGYRLSQYDDFCRFIKVIKAVFADFDHINPAKRKMISN
jgi:hypothetical protein